MKINMSGELLFEIIIEGSKDVLLKELESCRLFRYCPIGRHRFRNADELTSPFESSSRLVEPVMPVCVRTPVSEIMNYLRIDEELSIFMPGVGRTPLYFSGSSIPMSGTERVAGDIKITEHLLGHHAQKTYDPTLRTRRLTVICGVVLYTAPFLTCVGTSLKVQVVAAALLRQIERGEVQLTIKHNKLVDVAVPSISTVFDQRYACVDDPLIVDVLCSGLFKGPRAGGSIGV
jgi:hypothetical protein